MQAQLSGVKRFCYWVLDDPKPQSTALDKLVQRHDALFVQLPAFHSLFPSALLASSFLSPLSLNIELCS